ncbi:MAG: hypothetical protein JXQ27_18445 [Acidobacteria bacterium]|nr:hypothetical protein [Acidobacteriota bacterium]
MTIQNVNNVSQTFSLQDISNITQPKPSGWSKFKSVLGGIAGAASSFIPGAGIISGLLGGGGVGGTGSNQQWELLQQQYQIQQETQMFNMMTNVSKTKHDAAMSAIRNMKA